MHQIELRLNAIDLRVYATALINTCGEKPLTLNLGLRRDFKWGFKVATQPILATNFLKHYSLLVDIRG